MEIEALTRDDFNVWVPFEDAEVKLRYVPMDELRAIIRQATEQSYNPVERRGVAAHRGQAGLQIGLQTGQLDHAELGRLIGRAAVRGWRGITICGSPYDYTPERCDMLMTKWSAFAKMVSEVCLDLIALEEASRKQSLKNSSLTSGREGTSQG